MSSIAFNNDLEANPFADPFARPRSPDPWSSFGQQPELPPPPATSTDPASPTSPSAPANDVSSAPPKATDENKSFSPITPAQPDSHSKAIDPPQPQPIPTVHSLPEPIPEPAPVSPTIVANQHPSTPPPVSKSAPQESVSEAPTQSETQPASTPPRPPPAPTAARIQTPLDFPSPLTSSSGGWGTYSARQHFAGLSLGGEIQGAGWRMASPDIEETFPINGSVAAAEAQVDTDADDSEETDNLQTIQRTLQAANGVASTPHTISPMFSITVEDPQKVGGDPIRAYTMYTVHTRTSSPLFSKAFVSVLRRYSDFLWLHEVLSANHPGVLVPPVPEKSPFGRFQDSFVEQRRLALQQCIQKIANHPILCQDSEFVFFLESDNFALDMKHRPAANPNGDRGLMSSLGSSLVGAKFFEVDEWFDQKRSYFDGLESQLKGLAKAIDFTVKNRQEMVIALAEYSNTIEELAGADLSKGAIASMAQLSDVERKHKEMHDIQAREDTNTLMSTVDEYIRLINSVRLIFAARVRVYTAWQTADSEVRRIKANQDKARRQGKLPSDRIAQSLAEVQDAERRAMDAKQDFDKVSRLVKLEVTRFEKERIDDFKNALEALLLGMIARQKEMVRSLEIYQEQLLRRANPRYAIATTDEEQNGRHEPQISQ